MNVEEQRAVVVHCSFTLEEDCHFQLPTTTATTISDHGSQHKSRLLHKEGLGVPGIPQLMIKDRPMRFTLYFEPLPIECRTFTLDVSIQDNRRLTAVEIPRLDADLYNLKLELCLF